MKRNWLDSIFSDGSINYITNPTPKLGETVGIKLRLFKSAPIKRILLRMTINGEERLLPMKEAEAIGEFQYYGCKLKISQPRINYHFYICTEEETYYYNQLEIKNYYPTEEYDFQIIADFEMPKWIQSTVFYQIFPDRFYNGDPENDVKDQEYMFDGHPTIVKKWNEKPGAYSETFCLDFFGGDLQGIQKKIPYLKNLGVNALYLNPIFFAATNHKYDCLDYFMVDPHFGGDKALEELVDTLHKNDIKIILDVSINHTGIAHRWFNKEESFFPKEIGAYHNPESQEREYYYFENEHSYHSWEGVQTLPTLNYESISLRNILYRSEESLVKKWLKAPYYIDGWRFDVGHTMARKNEVQLYHEVWEEIRQSIKEVNEEAYILGEHWRDAWEFLRGNEWDAAMNYFGFCRPIRQFVGEIDHHLLKYENYNFQSSKRTGKDLKNLLMQHLARLPYQIACLQFNLLDSHDIWRLHKNPDISYESYRIAVIMLFTFPGTPSIYYGDEIGLDGHMEAVEGCRYPMKWDEGKYNQGHKELYQVLAKLKQKEEALQNGSFKIIYDEGYVISYGRFTTDKICLVVASQENRKKTITLPVDLLGVQDSKNIQEVFGRTPVYTLCNGKMELEIQSEEGLLFSIELE